MHLRGSQMRCHLHAPVESLGMFYCSIVTGPIRPCFQNGAFQRLLIPKDSRNSTENKGPFIA